MDIRSDMINPLRCGAIFALLTLIAAPAQAYVGPGAGLSLLGALWAVVVAVFAALFFVVMWPLRKMMKRRQAAQSAAAGPDPSGALK